MMAQCEILEVKKDDWTKCWWEIKVLSRSREWVILFSVTRDMEFIHVRVVDLGRFRTDKSYTPIRFYIPISRRTLHRLYPADANEVPRFFNRIVLPAVLEKIPDF
jgi:hypothetical protein